MELCSRNDQHEVEEQHIDEKGVIEDDLQDVGEHHKDEEGIDDDQQDLEDDHIDDEGGPTLSQTIVWSFAPASISRT